MNWKSVIYLVFIVLSFNVYAQNDSIFTKANNAYADKNYAEALRLYKSIEKKNLVSPQLYFNMGNTAYKLEQTAESIYYFEKALKLDPNDESIINNLAYAQRMKLDQFQEEKASAFNENFKNVLGNFSVDGWAYLVIIFLVLSIIAFSVFIFHNKPALKRLFFSLFIVLIIFAVCSFFMANRRLTSKENNVFAIIFAEQKDLLEEPNPNSSILLELHEGTKVKILDDFRDFYKVELPNGTKGWLNNALIKKI